MSRRDAACLAFYAALVGLLFAPLLSGRATLWFDDTHHWYYPIRHLACGELRAGRLPLWTPLAGGGYPLLAEGQCGALSPIAWLLAPLGMPLALSWAVALHVFIGGVLMHGFVRCLGARPAAAAVAAVGFMLSGAVVGHLVYVSMACTVVWLPGVWWGLEAGFRRRNGRPFLLAGTALAMALLAVHMQMAVCVVLLGAAYGAARCLGTPDWRAPGLGWLAAGVALAGLLAAPQLLPMLELVQHASRPAVVDRTLLTQYGLTPMWLMYLFAPHLFGHPTRELATQWGDLTVPWELAGYLGIGTVVLALAAPILSGRRAAWLLAVLWWSCFALAWGRTLGLFELLHSLPVLSSLRIPARWLVPGAAAGCALAGLGAEALWAGRRISPRAAAALLLTLLLLLWLGWMPVSIHLERGRIHAPEARWAVLCLAWMAALWLANLAAGLVGFAGRRAWLGYAVPALLAVDLLIAYRTFNPIAEPGVFAADANSNRIVTRLRPGERVFFPPYRGPLLLKPSTNLVLGVSGLESFAPLKLRSVDTLVDAWRRDIEPQATHTTRDGWLLAARQALATVDAGAAHRRVEWLRRFGVRLTLPEYGPLDAPPDADGLVELPAPLPPAWHAATGRAMRHDRLSGCRIVVRGGSGPTVLGEAAYPGWWAYAGGRREPVGAWRGVLMEISAGDETRLVYQPLTFRLGLFASLGGLAFLVAAWNPNRLH